MSALAWLPAASAIVVAAVLWLLLRSGLAARIALDAPNHRSLHTNPTPRVGGLVLVAVALAAIAWRAPQARDLAALAAVLFAVSAWDDRHDLPVVLRLVVQLLVAASAAWLLLGAKGGGWPAVVAATLAIAWAMNLYNFMDGSDGLAGGMAVIGFGALAIAAGLQLPWLALACAVIAACAAGFLVHNFPPAKVFMGDAGSVPLGFLAAALGAAGAVAKVWPWWLPVLVFAPFVVDATFTLAHRLLRGERPWQAHREHLYQRLARGGWGHRRTALAYCAVMLAGAVTALAARPLPPSAQWMVLGAWALVYGILIAMISRRFPLPGAVR